MHPLHLFQQLKRSNVERLTGCTKYYVDSTFRHLVNPEDCHMPLNNYWSTINGRLTRRRALIGGSGLGLSALAMGLLGCGGNSDGGTKETANKRSSLRGRAQGHSEGWQGGVWKHFARGDATHFDSLVSDTSQVVSISGYLAYAKLLKWKVGRYPACSTVALMARRESWELSPDKLT
jgi:hypothetical protein